MSKEKIKALKREIKWYQERRKSDLERIRQCKEEIWKQEVTE
jgi:hypothetical protein